MVGEIPSGVGQTAPVVGILQVQVEAILHLGGDVLREGRLADLARPEEHHCRRFGEAVEDGALGVSFNVHPC